MPIKMTFPAFINTFIVFKKTKAITDPIAISAFFQLYSESNVKFVRLEARNFEFYFRTTFDPFLRFF